VTVETKTLQKLFFPLLTLVILTGCAGIVNTVEPPYVSMSNLKLLNAGLFEQHYSLKLRIQNPNDFALPISGMTYHIYINERDFARGVSNKSFTVPPFGEEIIGLNIISNLSSILGQFEQLATGRMEKVSYRLTGSAKLKNRLREIPFEHKGEFELNLKNL
jgi:LEA14-like dessication related protein